MRNLTHAIIEVVESTPKNSVELLKPQLVKFMWNR